VREKKAAKKREDFYPDVSFFAPFHLKNGAKLDHLLIEYHQWS
jgi:hypothetical protein